MDTQYLIKIVKNIMKLKDNNNVIKMKEYLINEVYENIIDLKNKEEVNYL